MAVKRIENCLSQYSQKAWFNYSLLAVITALAAGLRFFKLGEWSFWIDEIFTMNYALIHFASLDLIVENIPPARNWIPTSVMLTAQVLNLFGVSEWGARLVSAVVGTLSIPILYFPLKKVFGAHVTLIALLLLAISPWHIYWSQNARFYTMLLLFYTLALFSFYFGIESNKLRYFFLFWVLVYLATSERLFAFFIFPVITVYLLVLWILKYKKPPGLNTKNILLVAAPVIAGGLIELYSLLILGESRFFADFNWFFLYRVDDPFRLLANIGGNIGISLIVLAAFSGVFLMYKKNRAGLLMLSAALVPVIILMAANPFLFTKDRHAFITLIGWISLAAYGVLELFRYSRGSHRWLSVAVLMILIFDAVYANVLYVTINHGNRNEWRAAFNLIKDRGEPEDTVVAYWPEFGPYYMDREILAYANIDIRTIESSEERIWFVLDSETMWNNSSVKNWLENNARLIDVRYLRIPSDHSLRIYMFDPQQADLP